MAFWQCSPGHHQPARVVGHDLIEGYPTTGPEDTEQAPEGNEWPLSRGANLVPFLLAGAVPNVPVGTQGFSGAGSPGRGQMAPAADRLTCPAAVVDSRAMGSNASQFRFTRSESPLASDRRAEILRDPGFGRYFTDHMAAASWTAGDGWHSPEVRALESLVLHPSAAVLHYAQEVFEGLKAYRQPDDSVALFRPEMNAARFRSSARRVALPELPTDMFLDSVRALLRADLDWVPTGEHEASLYLRPFMIAVEPFLGVRPAREVRYGVIASPAGSYFSAGASGITLWVATEFTRAASGGTGAAKCGGNYAASLLPQTQAQEQGCDQVLYTVEVDGERCIDESGTMNIFVVTREGQLVTPPLGTILAGVTRDSVLALAMEYDLEPVERQVPLAELWEGCADGSIVDVFAAGTAAVITPITGLKSENGTVQVADGQPGRHSARLRQHIVDLQFGRTPDKRGWMHPVEP